MVADELRRQADQFIELADIAPEFTRRVADRPGRQAYRPDETPADGADED